MQEVKIELKLDEYKNNSYLTHNYHPYPAKYIPQIPKEIISKYTRVNDLVLDPFCGSGTTLIEALLSNRNAIGVDLNPIAYLLSKVKTTVLSKEEISEIQNITASICSDILNKEKYPIPSFHNIDHWFKPFIQSEFATIKYHVEKIENSKVKDFLRIAFSSLIIKLSNQDSDTRYAYKEKLLRAGESAQLLQKKVADMLKRNIEFAAIKPNVCCKVYQGDSTKLDFIDVEVAAAITSPPYMNSFDYYLYHKHRMHWLGFDVKDVQEKEFGSRNKHNDNGHGVESYNTAIYNNAKEVKRLLRTGGKYCIVVGDSILRGEFIKMDKVFDQILVEQLGYNKVNEFKFDQRKYTKTFTPNLKSTYKDTYILVYEK
jgi:site-specific DNA-methyltransferase (cytosine-N4-specific)